MGITILCSRMVIFYVIVSVVMRFQNSGKYLQQVSATSVSAGKQSGSIDTVPDDIPDEDITVSTNLKEEVDNFKWKIEESAREIRSRLFTQLLRQSKRRQLNSKGEKRKPAKMVEKHQTL